MTDIFDATILCKKCNLKMKQCVVEKNGFELRAIECPRCKDKIIHPADMNASENFKDLADKKFNVKLRMVGNSHAISIPKEVVDFMTSRQREMHRGIHKEMDDMMRLWFDDFDTLKLGFDNAFSNDIQGKNSREKNIDEVLEDGRRVRRKVHDHGNGNVDVVEEQSLNSPNQNFRSVRIKKIRRFNNE